MSDTTPMVYIFEWALRSVAFFNTMAALWLSLAVLFNAERRVWGTWLAGGGLLLGGLFFAGHAAVVSRELSTLDLDLESWWRIYWLPFVCAPYLWYLVMAWYTAVLHTRWHRAWLAAVSVWGVAGVGLLLVGAPVPSYREIAGSVQVETVTPATLVTVTGLYPAYSIVCILLALWALTHPAASERFMGSLARFRARPWLVATSLMLLCVSLVVGALAIWFLEVAGSGGLDLRAPSTVALLKSFDLGISSLLAVTITLIGRAIVSYEIFTGRTLPRRGLFRQWRNSLVLAASCGALLSSSVLLPIDASYRLALAAVLVTMAYALLSWRSYTERQQSMAALRPFAGSQRLYEHLRRDSGSDVDAAALLAALSDNVLGARVAHLAALEPFAPFAGPTLSHPPGAAQPSTPVADILGDLDGELPLCIPVDPTLSGGAVWAVPLCSERGLSGLLLLGEKRDGSLYAQEEIEIARATGERLLDSRAGAEMARRLMALERQRLAESQVLDHNARRVLHDDVLPRLHAVMLQLDRDRASPASLDEGAGEEKPATAAPAEVVPLLGQIHHQISNLLASLPASIAPEVGRLGLVGALQQVAEGELGSCFDGVSWKLDPAAVAMTTRFPGLVGEVVFCAAREALRNAARHGRGGNLARPLQVAVSMARDDGFQVCIEDDGVGLRNAPRSDGGQGLILHSTLLTIIGGTLTAEAARSGGTRVVLLLPPSVCCDAPPRMSAS